MAVTPYLFLEGRCEEAIEFYKKHLGAEVGMMMRFKDAPPQEGYKPAPGTENRVMHACVTINGAPVMMSDGCADKAPEFKGFALSLDAKNAADGERMFKALSDGGTVQQPLVETFFAERFGMLADKFGVGWMVVAGPKNP
jgi:PhnB protein